MISDFKGIYYDLNSGRGCGPYGAFCLVGSRVIFINSLYDSNDDDHMAIADHRKIKHVFGTMDDFGLLRNITKEKKGIFEE